MIERIDSVVIGAGVVGLAIAHALARAGHDTWLLESESAIGTGVSARSSEVLHAGLYYPPASLKARLCVAGQQQLYQWCTTYAVPHRQLGKLVVATHSAQVPALQRLQKNASASGVTHLQWLSAQAAQAMEPALQCVAALYSPTTGIIDSQAFLLSLQTAFEQAGGHLVLRTPVLAGAATAAGVRLTVGGAAPTQLLAKQVVNATGLAAQQVAAAIHGVRPDSIPPQQLRKGNYFALHGKAPFAHLIYPLPETGGLGIHLTFDLAGQARFGPDTEIVKAPDYRVDETRTQDFATAIRHYWPALPAQALVPAYAGIRPQLAESHDFVIHTAADHGVPGLVNLYGIESPGLTSSLALAEEVLWRLASVRR